MKVGSTRVPVRESLRSCGSVVDMCSASVGWSGWLVREPSDWTLEEYPTGARAHVLGPVLGQPLRKYTLAVRAVPDVKFRGLHDVLHLQRGCYSTRSGSEQSLTDKTFHNTHDLISIAFILLCNIAHILDEHASEMQDQRRRRRRTIGKK
jgi:hypothetical protein